MYDPTRHRTILKECRLALGGRGERCTRCSIACRSRLACTHASTREQALFVLTDSSDYAVGISLEQVDETVSKRRAIAYFSQLLSPAGCSYPTRERQLLGIPLALRTWRHYLSGSQFSALCQTDHRPLQAFLQQTSSARQVRRQQYSSELQPASSIPTRQG
jgi:RNase H-like domain found in reverse transcriptase